jgi:Acyl-CoA dehydrogenase, N-terminal domain
LLGGCLQRGFSQKKECGADLFSPEFNSPYYKESHRKLQKAMRIFTDKELYPIAQECERTGKYIPQELVDSMSEKGILHMRIGPGKHSKALYFYP